MKNDRIRCIYVFYYEGINHRVSGGKGAPKVCPARFTIGKHISDNTGRVSWKVQLTRGLGVLQEKKTEYASNSALCKSET